MNYNFHSPDAVVGFRSDNRHILKKLIIFSVIAGYFGYLIYTKGPKEIIFLVISLAITFLIYGIKTKIKNPVKLIKAAFQNMFKKQIIDQLDVESSVAENEITVKIKKAESIRGETFDKTYAFSKENINLIDVSTPDNWVQIDAAAATIRLTGDKTEKTIKRSHVVISCYLGDDGREFIKLLKRYRYKINDAQAETEKEVAYQKKQRAEVEKRKAAREVEKAKQAEAEKTRQAENNT